MQAVENSVAEFTLALLRDSLGGLSKLVAAHFESVPLEYDGNDLTMYADNGMEQYQCPTTFLPKASMPDIRFISRDLLRKGLSKVLVQSVAAHIDDDGDLARNNGALDNEDVERLGQQIVSAFESLRTVCVLFHIFR